MNPQENGIRVVDAKEVAVENRAEETFNEPDRVKISPKKLICKLWGDFLHS